MNHGLTPYASREYVDNRVLEPKNYIIMQDEKTDYLYAVSIENGSFTSEMLCSYIMYSDDVHTLMVGTVLDSVEFLIYKVYADKSMSLIDPAKATFEPRVITDDTTGVTVKYNDYGYEHTTRIPVKVIPFDPETMLIDFTYTANNDGTYTLTGWKETLNGVASTDIVIPYNDLILV